MRLLVTTSTFPVRADDGIPRFILDLADAMSKHADVRVLAPDAPGAAREEQIGNVAVRRFRYFWPRAWQRLAITNQRGMRDNLRGSILAKFQLPLYLICQIVSLRRIVRSSTTDVVNAHWLVPQGLTAAWALRRYPDIKLVLHVHAGDVYILQRLRFGSKIARYVVHRCQAVFADGSHVRDALDQLLGYESNAILQPMGVDREQFGRPSRSSPSVSSARSQAHPLPAEFILFTGRLVEKKGAVYLVRAMRVLLDRGFDLGLVIAGFGPEEPALQDEVRRLELEDRVVFVGRQSHAEIVSLLHRCRVAAVPSIIDRRGETEGMPTVVVEALAAGVPVVGSDVDGIPDVIRHAENGWLCREKDAEDLADKLISALDCDRDAISAAAVDTAEKYDWSQVAANYMACLNELESAGEQPQP